MTEEQRQELQRCLEDPEYFREHYCVIRGDTMHWTLPAGADEPVYDAPPVNAMADQQRFLNRVLSQIPTYMRVPDGTYLPVPISHYLP